MNITISLKDVMRPNQQDTRTRWQIFSAAPHRLLFFGGFLQLLLTMLWWGIELIARYTMLWPPLPTVIFSTWIHIFLMLYGIFIFFIFGFLMTTYPRWMRGEEVSYRFYVTTFFLLISGIIIIYVGALLNKFIIALGILFLLAGWNIGFLALLRVYYRAPVPNKRYETLFNVALSAGQIGILTYLSGILTQHDEFILYAMHIGLWLFLLPILVGVCHRMIPYFSHAVIPNYLIIQPNWSLPLLSLCVIGHTVLSTLALEAWRFIFDLPLMLMVFHHSYYWGLRRSLTIPLLAMLHIAFLWLGIALLLYNIQSVWLLFSGQFILGKAPLHALTIGFMTSLVVGMASRVTLGHSGRMLIIDKLTWWCFLGISVMAVIRCLAELPPLDSLLNIHLNVWAALLWLVLLLLWVSRYLPITVKPRVDGKAG
jgi:uncharacterized protein involved in response to NO